VRAPPLMKAHNGWDTGIQVQNVGQQPTNVRIDYTASGAPNVIATDQGTLQPGESRTFYTPEVQALPFDFVGSAIITSDNNQPLVAIVNETKYQLGTAMTYTALTNGATTLIAPLAYKAAEGGYSTGVQVQNLSNQPAPVAVTIFTERGEPISGFNDQIAPNGSATYYLPVVQQVGPNFRGAVVVQSTNGQPLAAVINGVAYR